MSLHSRVRKITVDLTPEPSGINYVAFARQHKSFGDYTRSLLERWEPPLEELCEQVSDSVQAAMPEEAKPKEVAHAVRTAVRQAVFLCFLHCHLATLVSQEERALSLTIRLLEQMVKRILSIQLKPKANAGDESDLRECCEDFLETTRGLASSFYALSAAVRSIEASYFRGAEVLFDSSAETIRVVGVYFEGVACIYNELVAGRYPWANAELSLENLRADSRDRAKSILDDLVGMAELEALRYIGDQEGARETRRRLAERLAKSRGNATPRTS